MTQRCEPSLSRFSCTAVARNLGASNLFARGAVRPVGIGGFFADALQSQIKEPGIHLGGLTGFGGASGAGITLGRRPICCSMESHKLSNAKRVIGRSWDIARLPSG